jgi:hypothetical protein
MGAASNEGVRVKSREGRSKRSRWRGGAGTWRYKRRRVSRIRGIIHEQGAHAP